jgi:hypothetical protein
MCGAPPETSIATSGCTWALPKYLLPLPTWWSTRGDWMRIDKEYRELLSLFAKHRVRYLIVGAGI